MIMKVDMWKALSPKNKLLEAQDLFVQVFYTTFLWSIYRVFCQKFEEGNEPNTQDIINKGLYGGVSTLPDILKKQVLKYKGSEMHGFWAMKVQLVRRNLQVKKTKTANSLSKLFVSLTTQ